MASEGQLETIKVAEIYIKKGALDEAVEVLNEILAEDPLNALARQKLKEIEERRAGLGTAKAAAALAAQEAEKKAAEVAKQQVEDLGKKKAEDEVKNKSRRSSDDALSMMKSDDDEPIVDLPARAPEPEPKPKPEPSQPAAVSAAQGMDPQLNEHIARFLKSHSIETSLVIGANGKLLDSAMAAGTDAPILAGTAFSIFNNTEKAAGRMHFGGLQQVIITSADGRQIVFVRLKGAVLVAVTGKNTNLGTLRIAINDLMKKG
jgi:predicted regulator of Ras-like GTPase activity (Roadblock/LC7/MglB family)